MSRWWRHKYNRPSKDPLLLEYTWEELYVEFLEDQFEQHGGPENYVRVTHKDDVSEELARKMEAGEDVDLMATLSPEDREMVEKKFKMNPRSSPVEPPAEFADDYTKESS